MKERGELSNVKVVVTVAVQAGVTVDHQGGIEVVHHDDDKVEVALVHFQ